MVISTQRCKKSSYPPSCPALTSTCLCASPTPSARRRNQCLPRHRLHPLQQEKVNGPKASSPLQRPPPKAQAGLHPGEPVVEVPGAKAPTRPAHSRPPRILPRRLPRRRHLPCSIRLALRHPHRPIHHSCQGPLPFHPPCSNASPTTATVPATSYSSSLARSLRLPPAP